MGNSTTNLDATYDYNKNGQLTLTRYPNGTKQTLVYKDMKLDKVIHQKTDGTSLNTFSYEYDNNGNIKTKNMNGQVFNYTYDKLNRIETNSQFSEQYSYDNKGNRLTLESQNLPVFSEDQYEYDNWNRLTKITKPDGKVITYRYNGDGLLYERSENGQTVRYYVDGDQVLTEANIVNGTAQFKASYTQGIGLAARES